MTPLHFAAATLLALSTLVSSALVPSITSTTEPWTWPVGPPRTILRGYIAPATPYSAGHRGIDLVVADGLVTAPAGGTIRFSGIVVDRPVLSIDHGDGVISSYEPLDSPLKKGDPVSRGDPLGDVMPGHCSSLCVHFGVRIDGEYVSPLSLLGAIPYAVLLPTRR